MQEETFDVIVVGAGSGGLNIAGFMNSAGFKVLLIDKSEENIGGDCLNFGCVPSKALIHVARTAQKSREAESFGLASLGAIDMQAVTKYIKEKQDVIREHENAEYFRSKGMRVEIGNARFMSPDTIRIGDNTFRAKKIVLATGSRPRDLKLPGMQKAKVFNNENIFGIDFLPKKLAIIGGGPIGFEIGQAFRFLGSEVTIINRDNKLLSKEDPEIAQVLIERMKKDGVKFVLGVETKAVEDGQKLVVTHSDGEEEKIFFDALFVGIGRVLNTEGLDLTQAGIEMDERGKIKVNEYLGTTNPHVYLCGDIAGQHQFTHAAELHAGLILRNFFTPNLKLLKKKLDTSKLSWVTYTTPEIATFGQSEKELKEKNIPYKVLSKNFKDDDRAIVDDATPGISKIFISPKGRILGGTMVAEHAGELFQELVLAQSTGLNIKALFNKIYPYPTATRINKSLVQEHYKNRLTPTLKKILKFLYR